MKKLVLLVMLFCLAWLSQAQAAGLHLTLPGTHQMTAHQPDSSAAKHESHALQATHAGHDHAHTHTHADAGDCDCCSHGGHSHNPAVTPALSALYAPTARGPRPADYSVPVSGAHPSLIDKPNWASTTPAVVNL